MTSRVVVLVQMCLHGINWSAVKNDYTPSWAAWPWRKRHNDVPKRRLTIHQSARRNITYMLNLQQHSLISSNLAATIDVATSSHGTRSSFLRWVVVNRVSGLPIGPDWTATRWDRCCPATSNPHNVTSQKSKCLIYVGIEARNLAQPWYVATEENHDRSQDSRCLGRYLNPGLQKTEQ